MLAFGTTANAGTTSIGTAAASGSQGGAGTWDTTSAYWSTSTTTSSYLWPNTAAYDAEFGGTAGAVDLAPVTAITAGGMTYDTSGYNLTDGTLNLGGDGSPPRTRTAQP